MQSARDSARRGRGRSSMLTNQIGHTSEQVLRHQMGFTEQDIERRKSMVGFVPADARRITSIKELVVSRVEELSSTFFSFLVNLDEARGLINNRELLEKARALEIEHLIAMMEGDYGAPYV